MLLYGSSGTGKSLIINAVCQQVLELANSQGDRFGVIEINCQTIKSHDRAVYRLVKNAAEEAGVNVGVPESGISTDQKLDRFYEILSNNFDSVVSFLTRSTSWWADNAIRTTSRRIRNCSTSCPGRLNSVALRVMYLLLRSQMIPGSWRISTVGQRVRSTRRMSFSRLRRESTAGDS